jgi:hypothetical protein
MIEIKDLLSKFGALLSLGEGRIDVIRNIISETIGVQIKKEDIKIKNNIIYLNIKPIYKNEILLKQDQIFLKLKESLGEKSPQNIR